MYLFSFYVVHHWVHELQYNIRKSTQNKVFFDELNGFEQIDTLTQQ